MSNSIEKERGRKREREREGGGIIWSTMVPSSNNEGSSEEREGPNHCTVI